MVNQNLSEVVPLIMNEITVYIGLGSNLQNPIGQIKQAILALSKLPQTTLVKTSSLYTSDSLLAGQPRYTNAIVSISSQLIAETLLDLLQQIEHNQGRQRTQHWGARTLDLDIILYGNQQINTPRLTVPHSQMEQRSFVLIPLAEIAPDLILPNGRTITSLLAHCPSLNLQKLTESATTLLEPN